MDLKGAEIRSIYHLCSNIGSSSQTSLKVKIPYYQRPFKWSDNEGEFIKKLIYDCLNHLSETKNFQESSYFAGSIVMVDKDDKGYFDVIDGQQRITTLFLVNYLKFITLRSYIEALINTFSSMRISTSMDNLVNCYNDLIVKDNNSSFEKLTDSVITALEAVLEKGEHNNQQDIENVFNKTLMSYKDIVALPQVHLGQDNYMDEYYNSNIKLLSQNSLSLKYDRNSLNERIKKALSSIFINVPIDDKPKLFRNNDTQGDEIIKNYVNAVEYIYEAFYGWLKENWLEEKSEEDANFEGLNTFRKVNRIIGMIDRFLNNLHFCVIITGNEDDAYTLFEVLNDRALAVNDLDLVKNMFYKEYCTRGDTPDDDKKMDEQVEVLENTWSEEVFTQELGITRTNLIAYLATVYMTGDENLDYLKRKDKSFRDTIENQYLKREYPNEKDYKFINIKNDFKLFKLVRIIIDDYELQMQKQAIGSLKAENEDASITFRAIHLNNALKYYGVMSALFNLIIKTYMIETQEGFNNEIDESQFKNFIKELKNDYNNTKGRFRKIHECAFNIWRLVLLSKDYKIPRDYAKEIIKDINYNSYEENNIEITRRISDKAIEEFNEWISIWRYGTSRDFKVKLLLLKLYQIVKSGDKLILRAPVKISISEVEKIHLEHLEPKSVDEHNKEKYFDPQNSAENRTDYINSLGNFMIMDPKNNIEKDDCPAHDAIEYYKKMNVGDHWLVEEFDVILRDKGQQKNIAGNVIYVPTEDFFAERKNNLQKYFKAILENNDLDRYEIDI